VTPGADEPVGRVGLLWRGDRKSPDWSPRAKTVLAPLVAEFAERDVIAEPVVYADDAVDEVRDELLRLDGALVWVNPIQDGADRAELDALLHEVADAGVWVSAHPDVILAMGTKEVLYRTRMLGWGTDTDLYRSVGELRQRFPARLGRDGVRVLKQARGNGGNGTWKVELLEPLPPRVDPDLTTPVRAQHAVDRNGASEELALGEFIDRCHPYFAWSGSLVDQPFVDRLSEGMVRCYLVHDRVVGFCHQWPRGLLPADLGAERASAVTPMMEAADAPAYHALKREVERNWVPQMQDLLDLDTTDLPVIWDADFLYGPKDEFGNDTYVLCEINVSAVWPYPPHATPSLAAAAVAAIRTAKVNRQ
jgi:hypothetical protein